MFSGHPFQSFCGRMPTPSTVFFDSFRKSAIYSHSKGDKNLMIILDITKSRYVIDQTGIARDAGTRSEF